MKQLPKASKTCPSPGDDFGALAGGRQQSSRPPPSGPCFSDSICLSLLLILSFPIKT